MGTTASAVIDAIDIPILNLNEDTTGESIRDLIFTLGHAQGINDISTAIESSLSTAVTGISGLFSHHCSSSSVSVFSSENDDNDDDSDDGKYVNNVDNEEPTPSTSGNYLHEWTPQYSSSLSIFATLSSGNFLSENEVTQVFSRFVSIRDESKGK